jgi:hypothetical protein
MREIGDWLAFDSNRGVAMTDAELRIIQFLQASDATRPADLPDWLLALLGGDCTEQLSHELITAASLLYIRRLRPGISLVDAQLMIAEYAADPARLEDLAGRITAFRLACCFERLKRSGRFEDVLIDDPFDLEGEVSVKLTAVEWAFATLAATPWDPSHGDPNFSLN